PYYSYYPRMWKFFIFTLTGAVVFLGIGCRLHEYEVPVYFRDPKADGEQQVLHYQGGAMLVEDIEWIWPFAFLNKPLHDPVISTVDRKQANPPPPLPTAR